MSMLSVKEYKILSINILLAEPKMFSKDTFELLHVLLMVDCELKLSWNMVRQACMMDL